MRTAPFESLNMFRGYYSFAKNLASAFDCAGHKAVLDLLAHEDIEDQRRDCRNG